MIEVFHAFCIAPHLFQAIEFSGFGHENMHYYIHIIHQDPLLGCETFVFIGGFVRVVLHFLLYKIRNCLNLITGIGLTNDEEIGYRFRDLSQIKGNNVIPFLFLDGLYDGCKNLTVSVNAGYRLFPVVQYGQGCQ